MADVIVVGGGIVGAAVAWNLTRIGVRSVVLLEQATLPGRGATQHSGGLLRVHHTLRADIALAAASMPWFCEWGERIGGSCGYCAAGFVELVGAEHVAALTANVDDVRRHGVRSYVCAPDDLRKEYPGLRLDGVAAAAVEPNSGYGNPALAAASLRERFAEVGSLLQGVRAETILHEHGRVVGVHTNIGRLGCDVAVVACGAWSARLVESVGWKLPIVPKRIGLVQVGFTDGAATCVPAVIDDTTGTYFRGDAPAGAFVGALTRDPCDVGTDAAVLSADEVKRAVDVAAARLPAVATAAVTGTRVGFDGYTPDGRPLLGTSRAAPDGLFVATGFSGGGFKIAPAVGAELANLVAGRSGERELLAPYSPDRFSTQQLLRPENPYVHM